MYFFCVFLLQTGGEVLAGVSRQGAPTTSSNPWHWQVQTLPGIQWQARGANLRGATLASAVTVGAAGVAAVEGKAGWRAATGSLGGSQGWRRALAGGGSTIG